jgi:hypothetical protein
LLLSVSVVRDGGAAGAAAWPLAGRVGRVDFVGMGRSPAIGGQTQSMCQCLGR